MNNPQQPYEPGFHNIQPGQKCRILTLQIAVPAEADINDVYDEMSGTFTVAIAEGSSNILDWRYATEYMPEVTAAEHPVEGEIFNSVDIPVQAIVTGALRDALQTALKALERRTWETGILPKIQSALALAQRPTTNAHLVIYNDGYGWSCNESGSKAERDEVLAGLPADGQVSQDDIVYVDIKDGRLSAAYCPNLDESQESEGK